MRDKRNFDFALYPRLPYSSDSVTMRNRSYSRPHISFLIKKLSKIKDPRQKVRRENDTIPCNKCVMSTIYECAMREESVSAARNERVDIAGVLRALFFITNACNGHIYTPKRCYLEGSM